MRRLTALIAVLGLLLPATQLHAEPKTREFTLDNGMRLVVRVDNRAPVAVSQLWFPVGSIHEPPGTTGVSHVLEHMMFKGTEQRPTGDFSRIISREGGRLNAFTGREFTAYFEQLRADRLEVAFELEADRLANIRFDEDEFRREMEVVFEERRLRVDDNPMGVASERFNALAWASSPARQPIIGWQEDLEQLTLDDVRDWFEQWYGVNNALLVVVGDVDPEAVRDLAETHFGPLESRPVPELKQRPEIHPIGERRSTIRVPQARPFVMMGYQTPSLATVEDPLDAHALNLLSSILSGGASSRLQDRLVRGQEIAATAAAGYSSISSLDTQFLLQGRPASDEDLDALEQALRAEVQAVIDHGVTREELERARVQARADYVYRLDSLFYQAMEIGLLESAGIGWEAIDEFEEALEQVTPERIQQVAERYLRDERLTVLHLLPAEDNGAPRLPMSGAGGDVAPHSHD
ncbi:MAG: insulinase family protein [Ectothiorhodospiraceae bacterium]|nr:insulinase family protein [Ectothiorhodospiraceae bacterium]